MTYWQLALYSLGYVAAGACVRRLLLRAAGKALSGLCDIGGIPWPITLAYVCIYWTCRGVDWLLFGWLE